jgi:hypothetical protein
MPIDFVNSIYDSTELPYKKLIESQIMIMMTSQEGGELGNGESSPLLMQQQ